MGWIAVAQGDSKPKQGNIAEKIGDLPKQLNRVRSRSSLCGGIH
jgi:hypothetical protein